MSKIRILVAGCGHMGTSHARAYHKLDGFELVGLVSRSEGSRDKLNAELGGNIPLYSDYNDALEKSKPDAVSINTYPDTHAAYAKAAMEAGAHVFLEKPIAETVEEAQSVVDTAVRLNRKLVIGYILRHHPSWIKFVEIAKTLGKPLVMRMNLNQQSTGSEWETHKNLINSIAPIVDCGVHYVDVMCQMTESSPARVSGLKARLSDEIEEDKVNYGHLQVTFKDGSVGWYEAGWGPMMSETAFFVKDVVGPNGSATIEATEASGEKQSSNVDAHSATESIRVHYADDRPDEIIDMTDEPNHDELCEREQVFFLDAIKNDTDLADHMNDAVSSLGIVLAADQSADEGRMITFD